MDYAETMWADQISCGAGVLVDGGWGPEVFFEPIPKCSASLSSVLLRTAYMWTPKFVYDPTFCSLVSLSLGAIRNVFIVFEPLKFTCIPFFTCPFELFPQTLYIWHHYGKVFVTIVVAGPIIVLVVLEVAFC